MQEVNRKFAHMDAGAILAARKLPSGELVLITDSVASKSRIQEKANGWLQMVGKDAK